jgi:hypothetical protein
VAVEVWNRLENVASRQQMKRKLNIDSSYINKPRIWQWLST